MPILTGGERRRGIRETTTTRSRRGTKNKPSRPLASGMRDPLTSRTGPSPSRFDGGVYPPREDTFLLLPFARTPPRSRVLEIGTGSGEIALTAARAGARVVATDLNRRALAPLRRRGVEEALDLEVVRADLARGLGRFDYVLANPPYLPTPANEHDPDAGTDLALDGGPDGTRVLARLIDELPGHLEPGGAACVLISSVQATDALEGIACGWRAFGGLLEGVASRRFEGERLGVWKLTLPDPRAAPPSQT